MPDHLVIGRRQYRYDSTSELATSYRSRSRRRSSASLIDIGHQIAFHQFSWAIRILTSAGPADAERSSARLLGHPLATSRNVSGEAGHVFCRVGVGHPNHRGPARQTSGSHGHAPVCPTEARPKRKQHWLIQCAMDARAGLATPRRAVRTSPYSDRTGGSAHPSGGSWDAWATGTRCCSRDTCPRTRCRFPTRSFGPSVLSRPVRRAACLGR